MMTDLHDDQLPLLPYNDATSSGWSGSDTSRERAEHADADGTTQRRQRETLNLLTQAGALGRTWRELGVDGGWHHGQASGVLSVLHKEGRIARLTERRGRCAVYVSLDCVEGRETAPHGRSRPSRLAASEQEALDRVLAAIEGGELTYQRDVAAVANALNRVAGAR